MKQTVTSKDAPAALGPYSQAVVCGNTVYLSGQLGLDPSTGELVEGGVSAQTNQAFDNMAAILAECGLSLADVVKTTVYLRHMTDFAEMNEVYAARVPQPYPARSAVEVGPLAKGALVEIEAIAAMRA